MNPSSLALETVAKGSDSLLLGDAAFMLPEIIESLSLLLDGLDGVKGSTAGLSLDFALLGITGCTAKGLMMGMAAPETDAEDDEVAVASLRILTMLVKLGTVRFKLVGISKFKWLSRTRRRKKGAFHTLERLVGFLSPLDDSTRLWSTRRTGCCLLGLVIGWNRTRGNRLREDVWEWHRRAIGKLGDPAMMQTGFLRATVTAALDRHSETAICFDHGFAKLGRSWRSATVRVA